MPLPKLNIRLHGGLTPQQCVELARSAEAAGLAGLWFAENPFNRGILPAAAACAVSGQGLQIGAGVFNPFNRHPTLIAMEIGALDELAQGRVRLGIGSGIGSAVERMGFSYSRPLSALREAIIIVRALLRGEELTYAGSVFSISHVKLDYRPRSDIPIYMAARGGQSLQVCGELADGLLVSNMCAPAFTARAVARLREAARAAGRKATPGVVQYMPCSADPNRAEAHRVAKIAIAEMLPVYWSLGQRLAGAREALLDGSEISEAEFEAAVGRLRAAEDAATVLDDRFVAAFSLAGTADDCHAQAARLAAAGVTELALTFSGPQPAEEMRYLGEAYRTSPSLTSDATSGRR